MNQLELISGNIYVSSYPGQGEYIFVHIDEKASGMYINSQSKVFYKGPSSIVENNGFKEFRESTPTEQRWLRLCNHLGNYVPVDYLLKQELSYEIY